MYNFIHISFTGRCFVCCNHSLKEVVRIQIIIFFHETWLSKALKTIYSILSLKILSHLQTFLLCSRAQMDNILLFHINFDDLSRYISYKILLLRHVFNQKNQAFNDIINWLLLMSPYLVECADVDSSTKRYMLGM